MMQPPLNIVPFVSVEHMMKLLLAIGVEAFLTELAGFIEEDFRRWSLFDKTPRIASHSADGVIELMPTSDGTTYGLKYVNGHPKNTRSGRQTVTAFGVLADVGHGYPMLLTEMTFLTALRTAATSALAAKYLAPPGARTMAMIGNGAQAEFQALAFKALLGVDRLSPYDIDPTATAKCLRNLTGMGFDLRRCTSIVEAVEGAAIITTVTADKQNATILRPTTSLGQVCTSTASGAIAPVKPSCTGTCFCARPSMSSTRPRAVWRVRSSSFPHDHPVTELWAVIAGRAPGRQDARQITLFDSVGFAVEDFSALRYVRTKLAEWPYYADLDLLADPDDPRDLFGMLLRAATAPTSLLS
jgi:ornithine cyclodeaminase